MIKIYENFIKNLFKSTLEPKKTQEELDELLRDAVSSGTKENWIKFLYAIKNGANVNQIVAHNPNAVHYDYTILMRAIKRQDFRMIEELIKNGYELGAYIYDGCHIRNNKELKHPIIDLLNCKLTNHFNIENPLLIELIIKKMDLDKSYLDVENQYKLYQKYKKDLENDDIFKINSPFCFHNGNAKKNSNHMPLISQEELV